jgi:hypothetical protein
LKNKLGLEVLPEGNIKNINKFFYIFVCLDLTKSI